MGGVAALWVKPSIRCSSFGRLVGWALGKVTVTLPPFIP